MPAPFGSLLGGRGVCGERVLRRAAGCSENVEGPPDGAAIQGIFDRDVVRASELLDYRSLGYEYDSLPNDPR